MAVLDLLMGRRSVTPRLLTDPGPSDADLRKLLEAACRSPDHGALRPWRFITVRGDARIRLGEVFARARAQRDSNATEADLESERRKPLRAPLIIAVAAVVTTDHRSVRVIDQVLSAGCAAHAILLGGQALGYGGIWLTGSNCHDPNVKSALGLRAEDSIVGYLYLGTLFQEPPSRERPDPDALTVAWSGRGEAFEPVSAPK
ncbi:MAG: nitroreductase [Gammaproteobacteria bacterium]|nr:nitroreductase [Gammaproteobacteria bacterium]